MAQTKNVPWVVAGGKIGEIGHCTRCGAGLTLSDSQPIQILVAAMKAFVDMHRKCRPQAVSQQTNRLTPWDWIESRDTGVSSATIWAALMKAPSPYRRYDYPHDPDDFGRCYRLLEHFPEWKTRLAEVVERFPFWQPYIREWDSLAALYEGELASSTGLTSRLYARLQTLRTEAAALKK